MENNVFGNYLVVIVGAGPSGIATSALLNSMSIPNIVFEREDCCASLWKKRSYDRLCLHLAKNFCSLPMMPHSFRTATFMSKDKFADYVDKYVTRFNVNPRYCHNVESALYEEANQKWKIEVKNTEVTDGVGSLQVYYADFLVIATGENSRPVTPELPGIETFKGNVMHAQDYKCGASFKDQNVLVVGCGNSGMEISNDLAESGAHASIVVRSQVHVLSRELVRLGMVLLDYLPMNIVDRFILYLAKFSYGDLPSYGISPPVEGPFFFKALTGKTPVIDRGTVKKIRSGKIKVFSGVETIRHNIVEFKNGSIQRVDAIVMATGYRSVAHKWLKDYKVILDENDKPKNKYPGHWKGEKGVYCVGFSGKGIPGISFDSRAVANDIHQILLVKTGNAAREV
ncbi:PREDICTED: flavin-containing monooxygenase YUCCA10-like [Fragaria vesca subsp. vesca]|uniref:Flavin-containing monooxygenase n=1 Tax=Fragaria vesca TaxID=57918 RepID=I6PCE8_FRAVE|nr:Probable indole-3-pyruvate monooxygenase YUCCA10-like [Fragaria vesca]AFG16919.1 YUC11 [Fragaria vesca]